MKGVAIATCLQFIVRFLVIYLCAHSDEDLGRCFIPIKHEDSWKDLRGTINQGFESFLLRVMAWWAFDIYTQMSSLYLGTTAVAGQTIMRNIGLLSFMIPVGLSQATNFLTGSYIGRGKSALAHRISNLCYFLSISWAIFSVLVIQLCHEKIKTFYTTDETIHAKMDKAWTMLSIFVFFDCLQEVSDGMISGIGKLHDVRFVSIFGYWIVGIPLSIYAMKSLKMELDGLWVGPTVAVIINFILYEIKLRTVKWHEASDDQIKFINRETLRMKG